MLKVPHTLLLSQACVILHMCYLPASTIEHTTIFEFEFKLLPYSLTHNGYGLTPTAIDVKQFITNMLSNTSFHNYSRSLIMIPPYMNTSDVTFKVCYLYINI